LEDVVDFFLASALFLYFISGYYFMIRFSSLLSFFLILFFTASPIAAEKETLALDTLVGGKRWTGDFDKLKKARLVRVLVVPDRLTFFLDKHGEQRGILQETFHLLEKELNKKYVKKGQLPLRIGMVPIPPDEIINALVDGRGDIAAARLTITPERLKQADITVPTKSGVKELVVASPSAAPLLQLEDLSGKDVFVRPSSSYQQSLINLNGVLRKSGKPEVNLIAAPEDLNDGDILEMVNAGLIDYTIVDDIAVTQWGEIFTDLVVHKNFPLNEGRQYAWFIRKNSPQLKKELDAFLIKNKEGTLIRNILLKRYLLSKKYVRQAHTGENLKKFRELLPIFEKYGKLYQIDPLLGMAQACQESRLNHAAKSRVGAIGIMQIMPKTGKELGVGDIRQLEPNIHAGLKYIRFMVNSYFNTEEIDPLNRVLFAFASYNVGPGRMRKLRSEAKSKGFNPNKWFNHVEVIASQRVGSEPVSYVSNIYKYFVAYKLIAEKQQRKEVAAQEIIR